MSREKFLLHLYPHAWRERYGDELLAMLEQAPLSFSDSINLLFGALDAHLHPHLATTSMPLSVRMQRMFSLLRHSLLMIFCAYCTFILAGIALQKLTEYSAFTEAAQFNLGVDLSFHLVVLGAITALVAMLTSGLPIAIAIVRDALTRKCYGHLLLLASPLIMLAVFYATTLLLNRSIPVNGPAFQVWLSRGFFFSSFLAAAIISTTALCFAVVRSEISIPTLRFAVFPSLLTTISMALILLATLFWGLSLRNSVPRLFNSDNGILGTSTSSTWLVIVIVMAIATLLATISLFRGLSADSSLRAATR